MKWNEYNIIYTLICNVNTKIQPSLTTSDTGILEEEKSNYVSLLLCLFKKDHKQNIMNIIHEIIWITLHFLLREKLSQSSEDILFKCTLKWDTTDSLVYIISEPGFFFFLKRGQMPQFLSFCIFWNYRQIPKIWY